MRLEVIGIDAPGQLAAITKAIAQSGINISKAESRSVLDRKALNIFEVMVEHVDALKRVMRDLTR